MDGLKTDLNQLVIFAKVVETSSFTAAGRVLGLPKSTVSRKIAQLEERLGVQLLQRTTRRIALTESGAAFHEHCLRITADIAEAEHAVGRDRRRPHGLLRIGALRELGPRFLAASVNAFLLAQPEVDVELVFGASSLDPRNEGLDLVLRLGRRTEPELMVRELGRLRRIVVASPSYLAHRGQGVDALDEHVWVASRDALPSALRPRLVVDDSHGVGAFGGSGRGTEEFTGCEPVDILVGTLGKAFGVNGGYVTGARVLVDFLRETSMMYIYSNPITPAEAAAAKVAIDVLDSPEGLGLLEHLRAMTAKFEKGLIDLGFETIRGEHPVTPLVVRDTPRTQALVKHLFANGILATGLSYPVVPKGDEEIRFQVSADHTAQDIDAVLDALRTFNS